MVTSSDTVFSIVVDGGGGDRTIPEEQWGVLALCNGMRSVSEVADQLGRSMFEVSQMIYTMVARGLLEEAETTGIPRARHKETIDETFFVTIETELKKVLGPIGRIVMNDTIAAFGEPRDAFPKDQVESLIRTVCDQIVEDQKREKFGNAAWIAWLSSLQDS